MLFLFYVNHLEFRSLIESLLIKISRSSLYTVVWHLQFIVFDATCLVISNQRDLKKWSFYGNVIQIINFKHI